MVNENVRKENFSDRAFCIFYFALSIDHCSLIIDSFG